MYTTKKELQEQVDNFNKVTATYNNEQIGYITTIENLRSEVESLDAENARLHKSVSVFAKKVISKDAQISNLKKKLKQCNSISRIAQSKANRFETSYNNGVIDLQVATYDLKIHADELKAERLRTSAILALPWYKRIFLTAEAVNEM